MYILKACLMIKLKTTLEKDLPELLNKNNFIETYLKVS